MISDYCQKFNTAAKRRRRFQKRKLEILTLIRDSLERKLAAVNASLDTLEKQLGTTGNEIEELT